ncbi:hypothetical protein D3C75_686920 [compost metagenome]
MKNIDNIDTVLSVIESLYPTSDEYSDNAKFYHWLDYACELDYLLNQSVEDFDMGSYINTRLAQLVKDTPQHNALTDVASNLEEALPTEYKGVFKYE